MEETKRIARNTMIQLIGKAVVTTLALVGFGLATRYLGQTQFGFFATIYAFLAIFGILIDLGLQMTTTRLIADPAENESAILSNALTIRLLASVVFLGLAPLVILLLPYPEVIARGTAIAAAGFVFSSLVSTITSFFQKHLILRQVVIAEIIAKVVYLGATIIAVAFDLGLLGIIAAVALDSLLVFVILLLFASQKAFIRPRLHWPTWKKILLTTWPIATTIALNLVYFKGDIFIMSFLRSQAEVGLYGAPYRVLEVLINIIYIFLGLVLPVLATSYALKNFDKLKRVIQGAFDVLMAMSIPLVVGGVFVGRPLMELLAGSSFGASGDIIKVLLLATATIFIASLFGYVIVAIDKQKEMIKYYALNAIVSVIGYIFFINLYGYWGAAWMTVATEIFILLSAAHVMKKHISFMPRLTITLKALQSSAVMALWLLLFGWLHVVPLILVGAVVYLGALYLLKGFDRNLIAALIPAKTS